VWGLWQQNVGLPQLIEPGYTLCWAAKWLGEKEVYFASIRDGKSKMIRQIHKMMNEADAVCTYNGKKFDLPTLNKDFLLSKLSPPAPSKSIDLFQVVKSSFRFPSNKLAFISEALGIGSKVEHSGHELWIGCMANRADSWRTMEKYNKQDVKLLEDLYERLRPWIRTHPNHGLYNPDNSLVCPKCGHDKYQRRGIQKTVTCSYNRFQCCGCGGWFRSVQNIGPKPSQKFASL